MMRSLYSGVSGLQNHQVRMDVLGNNIANVNTTGFKKGRVNFQDMLSQTLSGAATPNEEVGGVNPKQIGLGMNIASIDTIFTQGSLQTTGVNTDLALQGEGFFVLKEGNKFFYTRAGAFGLDNEGKLVNPTNGMRVQGWLAQNVNGKMILNTSSDLQDIVIPVGSKDPARATTNVNLACNLDKRLEEIPEGAGNDVRIKNTWTVDKEVYDSLGNTHRMVINFTKVVGQPNQWQAQVFVDPQRDANNVFTDTANTQVNGNANNFTVTFSNLGALVSATDGAGANVPVGTIPITFNVPGTNPAVTQTFNLNLGTVGGYTNSMTQFAENSSTKAYFQDGFTMGYLESFKIDQSGMITGVFSNGNTRVLSQVALGSFTNPGGLEKAGDNTYVVSNNSGDANIGPSGIAGKGKILAGTLEMSNVDLAEQFTDMIVTQRGFQASSRTITTSDQMLQELLGLKR